MTDSRTILRSVFALAFAFVSPIVALYVIFGLAFTAGGAAFWWGFLVSEELR